LRTNKALLSYSASASVPVIPQLPYRWIQICHFIITSLTCRAILILHTWSVRFSPARLYCCRSSISCKHSLYIRDCFAWNSTIMSNIALSWVNKAYVRGMNNKSNLKFLIEYSYGMHIKLCNFYPQAPGTQHKNA